MNPIQKVIDMHCHLFNLNYLPVAGILRRYGGQYISPLIARGIEWLLLKNTAESFPVQTEQLELNLHEDDYNTSLDQYLGKAQFAFGINDVFEFKVNDSISAIVSMTRVGDVLSGPLSDALNDYQATFEPEYGIYEEKLFENKFARIEFRAGLLRRMLQNLMENA